MKVSKVSAQTAAELEGDATPFAASPRVMARRVGGGNQAVAVTAVHQAVLEALLATGYERSLAEKMAKETAAQVPTIEQKVQAA